MDAKYKEHGRSQVFRDKSKGGLFSSFLKEYRQKFGVSVTPSCNKCLTTYWNNYLNLFVMTQEIKCDYRLKAKYNGIQLGANGQPIRNGEMTNEIAKELLEKHPAGELLFDEIPEIEEEKDAEFTLKELRELYPDIKSNSREGFLKKIEELEEN